MLLTHVRTLVVTFSFGFLAACGMGGSGGGKKPPPVGAGSLTVNIAGLPLGVPGSIKVTGPGNYAKDVTSTQTLATLVAGSYTVTASPLASGTTSYAPATAVQTATVSDGATASVTVTYAPSQFAVKLQEFATLNAPMFLTSPANDARQFIVERGGRIRIMQNGALVSTPFLDVSNRVATGGEGGLLSMAFHPQYATNGFFFIYYTDPSNNIIVERRQVTSNPNVADNGNVREIIRIAHPNFTNHFGGLVAFGPDNMLYMATGDGGDHGDSQGNAQKLDVLLGKMLRLDVDNPGSGLPYGIPSTNPYAGQTGKLGQIWASGLRNPWRFTFDSGNLYIADVGESKREEVNVVESTKAGVNYGWNAMEGTACYTQGCKQTGLTLPVFEYLHGNNEIDGCSITGGFVYRGKALPELAGRYFYSDYCAGFLKSFIFNAGTAAEQVDWKIASIGRVVSFGRDADGELYLLGENGKIWKLVRAPK